MHGRGSTAAAAGIGIVNSVGNLAGYFGANIPVWARILSSDKSAALYIISAILMVGASLTYFFIPDTIHAKAGLIESLHVPISRL
jgi:hypothetical protein